MGKKRGRRKRRRDTAAPKNPVPDRRSMEKALGDIGKLLEDQEFESIDDANAFLQAMMASGDPLSSSPRTPLEQAQELIYEAWEATGRRRRVTLARKALKISADCADAYVLLAEETARTLEEARTLYAAGVEAGERALGPEAFEEYEGHFWGVLETRPYMRARAGLADCLWHLGHRREAITHYEEMLRLNPNDNQGIRYLLLTCLVEERADAKAVVQLLESYDDDAAAMWLYTRALFLFRTEGPSAAATAQLRAALQWNPHVPAFLLGQKRLPKKLPPYMGFGDETEAAYYALDAGHLWRAEAGALAWLRQVPIA